MTAKPNGNELLSQWRASGMGKREYWRMYLQDEMTYSAFHGATWRAEQTRMTNPFIEFPRVDLGKAWVLPHGVYTVVGDVHLNTVNEGFMSLMLATASKYTRRPRNLIISGDLFNVDAFSAYENDVPAASLTDETKAGRWFFREVLSVFDNVRWIMGNHDRRAQRRTHTQLTPEHLLALVTHDERVTVSHWGHCVVENENGFPWRITHGRNYSVNQLTVLSDLANKYQQNVIGHHQHHAAIGWDKFKRYVIVDNGGLFDKTSLAYAVLDDSKSPGMVNGFTILHKGYPTLYSEEPFTNWSAVLPEQSRKDKAA